MISSSLYIQKTTSTQSDLKSAGQAWNTDYGGDGFGGAITGIRSFLKPLSLLRK
jgi:hypothetical protein